MIITLQRAARGVYNIERVNNEDRFGFRRLLGSAGKHGSEINRPIQLRILVFRLKKHVLLLKLANMASGP